MRPAAARSDRTPLTREFGLPLYQQIHHLLRHRILTGQYAPGSKIPSESELCNDLAVSRVTVREALRALVRADMLVKVHGKGTFVAKDTPRRLQTVSTLSRRPAGTGFEADRHRRGHAAGRRGR